MALMAGIMGAVFSLYNLPLEPVLYGAALCGAAGLAVFFYGYRKYADKKKQLMEIRTMLPVNLEHLPDSPDGIETLYQEMLLELNRQRMEAETGRHRIYEEMTDYYNMWVHQIKTPIAAMRLLLQEKTDENREELSELFKIEQYVEMVLGYLRSEDLSSDMKFQELELDTIIREQVHKYARIFIGKKISLEYEGVQASVLTDGKWLGFVIGQILSNALKYTKTGKISIYMSEASPQTLVIEDTGIGINAADVPRVFEKGFTGYNGRGEERSSGIGLYLSAKIMKRLGHKITVESVQGEGTKVYLELGQEKLEMI